MRSKTYEAQKTTPSRCSFRPLKPRFYMRPSTLRGEMVMSPISCEVRYQMYSHVFSALPCLTSHCFYLILHPNKTPIWISSQAFVFNFDYNLRQIAYIAFHWTCRSAQKLYRELKYKVRPPHVHRWRKRLYPRPDIWQLIRGSLQWTPR